jgi:hypothetical protein
VTGALLGVTHLGKLEATSKKKRKAEKRRRRRKHKQKPDSGGNSKTLTFCQDGQTITAPSDQKPSLLAAGATLGACVDPGETCLQADAACAATSNCCGDLVCAYIEHGVGVCRVNHVPVAFNLSIRNPWRSPCVPITLRGYEPDYDFLRYRINTAPSNGFLTDMNLDTHSSPGWTRGLPAPPLPADVPERCGPRPCELFDNCDQPSSGGICPDCTIGVESGARSGWFPDRDGTLLPSAGAFFTCPEGWYTATSFCYIPYKSTFTGSDFFTFSMVDEHGAEGQTAQVNIDIYEPW